MVCAGSVYFGNPWKCPQRRKTDDNCANDSGRPPVRNHIFHPEEAGDRPDLQWSPSAPLIMSKTALVSICKETPQRKQTGLQLKPAICVHTRTHTHIHTHKRTDTDTDTHTQTHTHTHTNTHTHTHTTRLQPIYYAGKAGNRAKL